MQNTIRLPQIAAFLFILALPSIGYAGPLGPLLELAGELVQDAIGIMQVLLLGYAGFVGFKWFSGAPDAKQATAFLFIGAALLFGAPALIDNLQGRFG